MKVKKISTKLLKVKKYFTKIFVFRPKSGNFPIPKPKSENFQVPKHKVKIFREVFKKVSENENKTNYLNDLKVEKVKKFQRNYLESAGAS